ncbi:hypothetical protein [Bradyrhizobium sp. S3.5.5]|uniref:hypothetical protein n=1 Tax=Bradyrhizobium sp. S3.5.5 TaxID=3156430 RepID=UPI00339886AB
MALVRYVKLASSGFAGGKFGGGKRARRKRLERQRLHCAIIRIVHGSRDAADFGLAALVVLLGAPLAARDDQQAQRRDPPRPAYASTGLQV